MYSLPQCIFTLLNTSSQAPILDDPDHPVTTTVKRVKKQIPPLPEAGGHSYFDNIKKQRCEDQELDNPFWSQLHGIYTTSKVSQMLNNNQGK